MKCKKREYLNYSMYGVCGHTFAMSAYTSSLTYFCSYKKMVIPSICFNFQTLELQVAHEQKKDTEECDQKLLLIKEQRKLTPPKKAIFRQFLQQT